jgi:type II secretory pathway pseudopilin PulG
VELLVVITIIGILVALITTAAIGALRTARQAALKTEIDQISSSFEKYKDTAGSYPPNLVTDDNSFTSPEPTGTMTPIDESQVYSDLQRHLRQAFPRHKEPDVLLQRLVGQGAGALPGGMSAAEAVVFWLGGFSSDPQYPISGEGGPAYRITSPGDPNNRTLDPIESRKWIYQFDISRVGPREEDGYFPAAASQYGDRFIEYPVTINGELQNRRINFWQYTPGRSSYSVLYFDVSRHPAAVVSGMSVEGPYDPPAASALHPVELHAHALKIRSQSANASVPIEFANAGKFQILHCGIDDDWGADILEKTSAHGIEEGGGDPADPNLYLLFPTGPFTDAAADTIVNFVTQSRLEDAQSQ